MLMNYPFAPSPRQILDHVFWDLSIIHLHLAAKNNCFSAKPKMKLLLTAAGIMTNAKKMQKQLHLKERTFTSRQRKSCSLLVTRSSW